MLRELQNMFWKILLFCLFSADCMIASLQGTKQSKRYKIASYLTMTATETLRLCVSHIRLCLLYPSLRVAHSSLRGGTTMQSSNFQLYSIANF
jgi:hypothetical protein